MERRFSYAHLKEIHGVNHEIREKLNRLITRTSGPPKQTGDSVREEPTIEAARDEGET